jgi:Cu-Zn family superoxide dismutase
MLRTSLTLAVVVVAASGCMNEGGTPGSVAPGAGGAVAELRTAAGARVGEVRLAQTSAGLSVQVDATGMPPGQHGVHVHMVGRCDPPEFTTAGGHWNPASRQHGLDNPAGPHGGDLPNLIIAGDGTGRLRATLPAGTLRGDTGLFDADGAAFVVHAAADDLRTDPSGNSGGRIACGVFRPA